MPPLTADQLFAPDAASGTQLPESRVLSSAELFPQPALPPSQSGAAFDAAWSARDLPINNVLNAMGLGASDAWGGARPLGLDAESEAALKRASLFNDPTGNPYKDFMDGHVTFAKTVNEALIRPVAATVDAVMRGVPAAFAGAGAGLAQVGAEVEGANPNTAQRVAAAPFKIGGELGYAGSEGLLGPESGFGVAHEGALGAVEHEAAGAYAARQAEMVQSANEARSVGAVGEGEAGYYDAAPLTPENAAARNEAASAAGVEPIPPEPPPPDVHTLARRIDPDTFEAYDALALERENHRATVAALGEERATSPEALEAQSKIDTIMGRVNGVESRLTGAARERLAAAQERLDAALTTDTPEMRQARTAMMNADFAMRDLAPDVSAAYRQAREMAPDLPLEQPPPEIAGEEAKPQAKAETAATQGEAAPEQTMTPEQEAGIRAAPVAAEEAAREGQPANVVGGTVGEAKAETATPAPASAAQPAAAPALETGNATSGPTPLPEASGPSPGLRQAAADVAEYRSKRPPKSNIIQAIKKLGGIKTRNIDGSLVAGPDVQGAIEKLKYKPIGLVNNEGGLSPERMHEALAEQGWFGHGDVHPEALVQAIEEQARGKDVYHPESGLAEAHARRGVLDEEMTKAGVKRGDDATTAAMKLSHWREVETRTAERMETLRARAGELGIGHDAASTYDGLLSDILEREAIEGDATEYGYDTYEDDIDAALTDDDIRWLNRYFEEQHGEGGGAFGVSEAREPAAGTEVGAGEPAQGAAGGGEGSGAAGPTGAGRGATDFGVVGTGAERVRGVSQTTETRALENGLEQEFGDLPSYNQMSKADQAARVVADMDRDWEGSVAIAMGEREPPRGVLPESYYEGVRMRAIAMGDWETTRQLATESALINEATTMGRRIAMYAQRDPVDPVAAIKEVAQAREKAAGASLAANRAAEVASIRDEVAKAAPDVDAWQSFLRDIEC